MKYYICHIKITIKMKNTNTTHKKDIEKDIRYLQLLSRLFPTIASASTEIINLEAILNLPKGTEHFLTDIHGEYEAFQHVLKNASGSIKRKVNEIFGSSLRETEKKELCRFFLNNLLGKKLSCFQKQRRHQGKPGEPFPLCHSFQDLYVLNGMLLTNGNI